MNLKLRSALMLPCLASVLAVAGFAHASTITGTVFTTAPYPAPLNPSETPSGTNLGTFTSSQIDFFGGPANNSPSYTVGGFLNSNGSVSTLSAGLAGMSLNNKELQFMGNVFLVGGQQYSVTHDDGIFLYLGGSSACTICSGAPTSPATSSFSVGTTGNYSFDLLYAEVNGAPATLNFPATVTPEPSSFILLGSGLVGVAGMLRRRFVTAR